MFTIGVDGYEANVPVRVGIGQYAYHIITELSRLASNFQLRIFLPSSPLADMPAENENVTYVVGKPGKLWTVTQLPFLIQSQKKVDVFFSPTHYAPWFISQPIVLSVMDLSYIHYPELFTRKDLIQLKYMGGLSIRSAKKILTISQFSKTEIHQYYKFPLENIEVTYPGVTIPTTKSLPKTSHSRPYILFVGTIQPRKNIERLIEAFEMIDFTGDLLLVGKKGWLFEKIFQRVLSSKYRDRIHFLEFVASDELQNLYQNAQFFVLPSLYEGFGIPVVEAMASGVPVVVSNTSSLPEVAGVAGISIDPLNVSDIARGMTEGLQLSKEQRKIRIANGIALAKKFTWEACAQKTLIALKEVAQQ